MGVQFRSKVSHERVGSVLAGVSVLLTVALGFFHSPWWLLSTAGLCVSMIVTAVTNRCVVKNLLIRMGVPGERDLGREEALASQDQPGGSLKVLLVYPRFPVTFWSLSHLFRDILVGPRHTHPPLPLLTLAAFFPKSWEVRLVDENVQELAEADLHWADVVMVSAMQVQDRSLLTVLERAHAAGKPVVAGGPGPTLAPQFYEGRGVDYLHVGEVGDATVDLFRDLAAGPELQARTRTYRVERKLDIAEFPPPRYELIRPADYLQLTVQFASGCPFNCEFCEIPSIYGRVPRVKPPELVIRELDGLYALGHRGAVLFVDDNFLGNVQRVRELLPLVIRWQKEHGEPFAFSTQVSVNLADHPDVLAAMRDAGFHSVFLGIETPRAEDLRAMG
jgi:radical SAM superfamily enzyme YgiQ (UPF0313 family)